MPFANIQLISMETGKKTICFFNLRTATIKVKISGGNDYTLGLSEDGTVWSWGGNGLGQLGDGTKNASNAPVQVSGLSNIVDISAGYDHAGALKSDGTVWAWGQNILGQLGNGLTAMSTAPVQVQLPGSVESIESASTAHNFAVKADGTIWAWGWNANGQLGDGTSVNRLLPVICQFQSVKKD